MQISCGNLLSTASFVWAYMHTVDDTVTSTMVDRMQMDASPAPLRFIRYTKDDRDMKCFVL